MPTTKLTTALGFPLLQQFTCSGRVIPGLLFLLFMSPTNQMWAQTRTATNASSHYLLDARNPPGAISQAQVAIGKPGVGSFTAVSIMGSEGLQIGLAKDGHFLAPISAPVTAGMLVGAVYRFRVTNIPSMPGEELYPTVEIIDRICPEAGREHRFPIPIMLAVEDLELALHGSLVTRVIYLEDSSMTMPVATSLKQPLTIDVSPAENALQTADQLGKPVAILRIGSRVPTDLAGDLSDFLYGCPPWVPLPVAPNQAEMIQQRRWSEIVPAQRPEAVYSENPNQDFPRTRFGD